VLQKKGRNKEGLRIRQAPTGLKQLHPCQYIEDGGARKGMGETRVGRVTRGEKQQSQWEGCLFFAGSKISSSKTRPESVGDSLLRQGGGGRDTSMRSGRTVPGGDQANRLQLEVKKARMGDTRQKKLKNPTCTLVELKTKDTKLLKPEQNQSDNGRNVGL